MKQRESLKLKESAVSAKQETTDHYQSQYMYSPSSLALFETDSKQPSTIIRFTHEHIIFRI